MHTIHNTAALALASALAQDFAGRAEEADRCGELPAADLRKLKGSGYFGLSIPEVFGGPGLSLAECAAAQVALAQGSPASAIVAAMPIQIFGHARETAPWPETTMGQFCQAVLEEGALFNSVASERALGSPSRGHVFQTVASPDPTGAGWLLRGHKTWATGGRHLTHMLVRASIEAAAGEAQPGVVLVLQGMPGVRWERNWRDALSLRASESDDVFFEDVPLPEEYILQRDGEGPAPANVWFPMMLAAVYLGAAMASRDAVIRFALERVPSSLGRPITTLPAIQQQIGDIDLALQAARTFFFDVAAEWSDEAAHDEAARRRMVTRAGAAKTLVVETAAEVTEKALRLAGGSSLTHDLPLERYFRDVRAGFMQPPSPEKAREQIGQAAIAAMREEADRES